jgi:hypothetical protein
VSAAPDGVGVDVHRFNAARQYITDSGGKHGVYRYNLVLCLDSRDAIFQADPFAAALEVQREHRR